MERLNTVIAAGGLSNRRMTYSNTHSSTNRVGDPVRMSPWNAGWLQTQYDVKADITSTAQLHKVLQFRYNSQ